MPKPHRTYYTELIAKIRQLCPWKFRDTHYTLDGVETTFTDDFDGQEYVLSIRPKGKKE